MEKDLSPETGTMIEGIGDEVLYGSVMIISTVASLTLGIFLWQKQRSAQQEIHPQSQSRVNTTREQLSQDHTRNQRPTNRPRERDINCPICLVEPEFAVETNCGHTFCGICMTTYWTHGNWLGAIKCPVCRQQVTVLMCCFTEDEQGTNSPSKSAVLRTVNHYNRRFSGEPVPWIDYLRDLPTLLRHCLSEFFSVGGLIWMFRLRILICFIAAIIYFISPLDIIPEAAFGILGFLDDFFVLLLLAIYISIIYRRYLASRGEA